MTERTLRASKWTMNMQCDRLLAMFMGVSQMVRFVSPRNSCKAAGTRSSVHQQRELGTTSSPSGQSADAARD